MRRLTIIGLAALHSATALAALPPQYQRVAELSAILGHRDVVGRLAPDPIDRIEYAGRDLYRVTAGRCSLEVRVFDVPGDAPPGPRRFRLDVGNRVCK